MKILTMIVLACSLMLFTGRAGAQAPPPTASKPATQAAPSAAQITPVLRDDGALARSHPAELPSGASVPWGQPGGALSASGRTLPGIEARTPSDQRERPGQNVASPAPLPQSAQISVRRAHHWVRWAIVGIAAVLGVIAIAAYEHNACHTNCTGLHS